MKPNVIDEVVRNDLCIGCGICVGLCPHKVLEIKDNEYGEYVPHEMQECSLGCSLCLKVCPFSYIGENETKLGTELYGNISGIKYLSETGYYSESYVGYSNEFRQTSASGGMATWFLKKLLKEKIVDYVVCPVPIRNTERLFDFEILEDADSLVSASGSVYYPVELSRVTQKIMETPGRYAITGLPCFIKGLRLACKKNRVLKERIIFTIGLVCGQMKSKHYTEYISGLTNSNGRPQNVYYRGKSLEKPASNFYFQCVDEKGLKHRIFWNEGVSEAWVNRWFTPNACNYCDDIFAELADVTFMDAWLPEYYKDHKGTNLVLVRTPKALSIIQEGMKNMEINVNNIPITKIIQSQKGVIDVKRSQLSYRLYLAKQDGLRVPTKRIQLDNKIGFFKRQEVELKDIMQKMSKNVFLINRHGNLFDTENFRREMKPNLKKLKIQQTIEFVIAYKSPTLVLNKMKKLLCRNSLNSIPKIDKN